MKGQGMRLISKFIAQVGIRPRPDWAAVGTYLMRFVIAAGAYFVLARLSVHFAFLPDLTSPFWPPSAIALYVCLAWGMRYAPAIWFGSMLNTYAIGAPWPAASIFGISSALEACMAAYLIQRLCRNRSDFIYRGPIFRFIGIALLSAMIGASIGTIGIRIASHPSTSALLQSWVTWWLGDATGMIIVLPLLLAWNIRVGVNWRASKIAEAVAFLILLPTITQFVFGGFLGRWPVAYLSIPFFLWAAFRFNLPTVTWTTVVVCAIAVWNTANGDGPFASDDLNASLLLLMIYFSVVATMSLALASEIYQRSLVETALRKERDGMEQQVRQRTTDLQTEIEERKHFEQELASRERQLAEAQRVAQIGSWNWDIESGVVTWSDQLYRIYDVSKESFIVSPASCQPHIHSDDLAPLKRVIDQCLETGQPFSVDYRIVLQDGSLRYVTARGQGDRNGGNRVVRMFGTVQDVTDARLAESSLREAEERYRKVVELSPDAILVQQDGVFVFANGAAMTLLGASSASQIVGRPLADFLHADFHALKQERIARLQEGETFSSLDEKFIRLDGTSVDVEVNSSPFLNRSRRASLFIMRDITERKKTAEQLAYLAHYDSLTGLPNRMLFHQRLEHALTIAERPGRSLELLFLDLDRFKNINDTLGHGAGDRVLQETASRLQDILRESDTVARLGGDEFVVLVENVDEPHRGGTIAEKILAAFAPPFLHESTPLNITTSIGISSFPDDGTDADTLLKNADVAMYRAKEMGRNNFCYYSPELNRHTTERLSLEYALSHALEQGQLSLYYQPKVDVVSKLITGMEALLRWRHPTLGMVPTHQFIPVAEDTGLIKPLGYWAIRAACKQNKHWQDTSPARLKVSVNLSARQLADEKLVENIAEILRDTELDPHYLELEISESAVMANPEKAVNILNALRDIGVSIVIDDFGIGYSSLAYLKQFPIRSVKIDRSFMQGIPANRDDSAVARAIISLAHGLDCSVIAQGAETQQQYDFLREHACDSVQGFYFSEPIPAESFADLIKVQSNLHLH
jgi:diguanylate cyclase (GGDEF)-like protein/PAS domain S-box-containing protein